MKHLFLVSSVIIQALELFLMAWICFFLIVFDPYIIFTFFDESFFPQSQLSMEKFSF